MDGLLMIGQMPYPQYMLNPGDMFSVDLEKVLFATGAPKGLPTSLNPRRNRKRKTDDEEAAEAVAATEETPAAAATPAAKDAATPEATKKGKGKAAAEVKPSVSMGEDTSEEATAEKKEEFNKEKETSKGINWWDHETRDKIFDPLKPYRTPWRPRYYLSAFAFIPKYLEVNHSIGHAVYLRDPVASPGLSEVRCAVVMIVEWGEMLIRNRCRRRFTVRRYSSHITGSFDGGSHVRGRRW